ncbi:MAG: hypothetical protein M0P13_01965 [Fibrobacteraceae bacterium]|nr:hypothetical protein [Fibrobacteraceae bacterium]
MIFEILIFLVVLLVGGLLLFPVKVRFLFKGIEKGSRFEIRIFKKKIFSSDDLNEVNGEAAEKSRSEGMNANEDNSDEKEENFENEAEASSENLEKREETSSSEEASIVREDSSVEEKSASPESSVKGEKPEAGAISSDKEFLMMMIEPHFDGYVLKKGLKLFRQFFKIFHCKFEKTVVEGIRLEYNEMGIATGMTGMLAGMFPLFENWEWRMDWCHNKVPKIEGTFVASFSLLRILSFATFTLFYALSAFRIYRKNKKRFKGNPSAFHLVFWRRWTVNFLASGK